jgi:hypothetical protein
LGLDSRVRGGQWPTVRGQRNNVRIAQNEVSYLSQVRRVGNRKSLVRRWLDIAGINTPVKRNRCRFVSG